MIMLVSFLRQWKSGVVAKENAWPTKPKVFTIWTFTKRILLYRLHPGKSADLSGSAILREGKSNAFPPDGEDDEAINFVDHLNS